MTLQGPIFSKGCMGDDTCTYGETCKCDNPNHAFIIYYHILVNMCEDDEPVIHSAMNLCNIEEVTNDIVAGREPINVIILSKSNAKLPSKDNAVLPLTRIMCDSSKLVCHWLIEYLPELYNNSFDIVNKFISFTSNGDSDSTVWDLPSTKKVIKDDDYEVEICVTNTPEKARASDIVT